MATFYQMAREILLLWIMPNKDKVEITHINLNDDTIEGIRLTQHKAFSIQYHPEASPGPHDARYLFDEFVDMIMADKNALTNTTVTT